MKKSKKQQKQKRRIQRLNLAMIINVSHPKIIEIANKLELSPTTVYNALSSVAYARRLSEKTFARIRKQAKDNGLLVKPFVPDELREQMSVIQKKARADGWTPDLKQTWGGYISKVRHSPASAPVPAPAPAPATISDAPIVPLLPCSCEETVSFKGETLCMCSKTWKLTWIESGQVVKNGN